MTPSKPQTLPPRAIIGMVHVAALPGAPAHSLPLDDIARAAADEARILAEAGFDALLIENMHDRPYLRRRVGPETVAAMTRIGLAVRAAAPKLPLGVQILAGANVEALSVAHAVGASFIRAEGFVFASIADEGLLDEADAARLLRHRKSIGADGAGPDPRIAIYADIKKKHSSHAITADVSLAETAEAALFFGTDGVIVTGAATGRATSLEDLASVRTALPNGTILVGSGAAADQIPALFAHADALIVGSALKRDGVWSNPVDPDRARRFADAARNARR